MNEIFKQIKEKNSKMVYLIYGEDHPVIKHYANDLLEILIPGAIRDGNYLVMNAKGFSVNHLIEFCSTLPFLASRRVITIENCPLITESRKISKKFADEEKILVDFLNHAVVQGDHGFTLIFLIYEDADKIELNKNHALCRFINQYGYTMECPLPQEEFELIHACSEGNSSLAIQKLDILFTRGWDPGDVSYRLMSNLRYPIKKLISDNSIKNKHQVATSKIIRAYINSLNTEDRLRPRFQDWVAENPKYLLEDWILGQE